jgi:hypothetical protein
MGIYIHFLVDIFLFLLKNFLNYKKSIVAMQKYR